MPLLYASIPQRTTTPANTDEHLLFGARGTERMPWSLLRSNFVSVSTAPSGKTDSGAVNYMGSDSEFLYFRNNSEWQRLPYDAGTWADDYVRLLRPVAPSLASDPAGTIPNGYFYYNTTSKAMQFRQDGAFASIPTSLGFVSLSDGSNTAGSDLGTTLRLRSSDSTVTITVTEDDPTYGNVANFQVDPSNIATGDLDDDGTFSLVGHDHDADYAALAHNHDGVYSPVGHNHDATYAALVHNHDGVYATVSHNQAASTITSGTFDDARIAASNVTQHVAAIDHDALLNFVANEHVNHSSVSVTVSTGLTGGGDLTTTRNIALDVPGLTALVAADTAADYLLIYDADAGAHKKILIQNIGLATTTHTHNASAVTAGTLAAARGGLGADASAFAGLIKMSAGVASVAVAGTDYAAGSHTHSASSVTSGTLSAARGGIGADGSSFAGLIKMSSGIASVAVANTDYSAPGHGHTASEISDFGTEVSANTDVAANTAAKHTQNTDTGTTSTYFQLATGSSGGRVYWTSSEFQFKTSDGSAYAPIRVGDLYVTGSTTSIDSNTVNIGDAEIVLNNDLDDGMANSDGGVAIKLLDDTDDVTRRDAKVFYDVSERRWQWVGFTATTEAPITRTAAAVHTQLIGNGSSQDYTVTHKLNTLAVVVSVINVSTGAAVLVDWTVVDADTIQVSFGASNIPSSNSRRVTVVG